MIIGCGKIASQPDQAGMILSHAEAYKSNLEVKLEVCMDLIPNRAEKVAKEYNCKVVTEINEGLRVGKPDIVSVCTPDETHFKITKDILCSKDKPRVIFLEKPACSNDQEFNDLLVLATENDVSILVNHSRRFNEHHIQLRERIRNGDYGVFFQGFAKYYSGWKHNGIHVVDTLSFLLDDELKVSRVNNSNPSPYEGDPTLDLEMHLLNNQGLVCVNGVDEEHYQIFELDLLFSKYRLRIEDFGQSISLEKKRINQIGENILEKVENGLVPSVKSSMENAIDLIVKSILEENTSLLRGMTLRDIHSTMRTIWNVSNA
jgi:predicted dehydrogenase